jgi:hypothetical protein
MHSVYIVVEHMAKKIKRNEWIYNGYTWTNPDGRSLTRDTSSKPQATSGKPQAASCDNLSHLHKKKSR